MTQPSPFDPAEPDGTNDTLDHPVAPDGRVAPGETCTLPARQGGAVVLERGQRLTLINPSGTQVCDFWAFNRDDLGEYLSMEHLRTALGRTIPRPGDALVSNRRRTLLTLLEDTSPGVHDTLIAACDLQRYRQLGVQDRYHDNCQDNLRMALRAIGLAAPAIPAPFNVWMNVPVRPDGEFRWCAPVASPGDRVVFRAEMGCVAVMSACPQDITPVNGVGLEPQALQFRVD